jgi:glucose-1-phosphate thymidylyltransferase
MKAVILAAGAGTRMAPLTNSKPKVMIEVGNRPILEHLLDVLTASGIHDIIMVVGYKREKIMNHFGDGKKYHCNITYAVQEHQLGTADAFLTTLPLLQETSEPVLLVPGDNLVGLEGIKAIVEHERDNVLLTTSSRSSTKYGVVRATGEKVISIEDRKVKKGEHLPISTGIIRFSPQALKTMGGWMGPHTYSDLYEMVDLSDVVNRYLDSQNGSDTGDPGDRTGKEKCRGGDFCMVSTDTWSDVVEPWDLLYMNDFVIRNTATDVGGDVDSGVTIRGPVKIGAKSRIRSGSCIYGPVVIGKGCEIGPGAAIRSSTTIGDNVSIGPHTQVKNSIIFDGTDINMGSDIVNSVIGEGATIGSHFVSSTFDEDTVESHGVIIGEDTIIHPKVVTGAGVIIGKGCMVKADAKVDRDLPDDAWVLG